MIKNSNKCLYCKKKLFDFKNLEDFKERQKLTVHKVCYKDICEIIEVNQNNIDSIDDKDLITLLRSKNKKLYNLIKKI